MRRKLLNTCLMTIMVVYNMSAYALDKINGVYQIGSTEDYFAFVELVNGGEKDANAILTADIDLGTNNTKIAANNSNYLGTFDGAGHTITIDFSDEWLLQPDNEYNHKLMQASFVMAATASSLTPKVTPQALQANSSHSYGVLVFPLLTMFFSNFSM